MGAPRCAIFHRSQGVLACEISHFSKGFLASDFWFLISYRDFHRFPRSDLPLVLVYSLGCALPGNGGNSLFAMDSPMGTKNGVTNGFLKFPPVSSYFLFFGSWGAKKGLRTCFIYKNAQKKLKIGQVRSNLNYKETSSFYEISIFEHLKLILLVFLHRLRISSIWTWYGRHSSKFCTQP